MRASTTEEIFARRKILRDMKKLAEQCDPNEIVLAAIHNIEVELLLLKLYLNCAYD